MESTNTPTTDGHKRQRVSRLHERREARPAVIDPHQLYSVTEYAAARDISEALARREIKAGVVRAVREGRRIKITGAEIIRRNQEVAAGPAA